MTPHYYHLLTLPSHSDTAMGLGADSRVLDIQIDLSKYARMAGLRAHHNSSRCSSSAHVLISVSSNTSLPLTLERAERAIGRLTDLTCFVPSRLVRL